MEVDSGKNPPIVLRALAKDKCTSQDYQTTLWPLLRNAICALLTKPLEQMVPISYEELYRCVYHAVCNDFSQQLMKDLTDYIEDHLNAVSMDVQTGNYGNVILRFGAALKQYNYALSGIVPIFSYLNRYYVQLKLNSNLENKLNNIFFMIVCDPHHQAIIAALNDPNQHNAAPPEMVSEVVKKLYSCKPGFVQMHLHPQLFARYLPGIIEPSQENNLNLYAEEARQQQEQLERQTEYRPAGNQTEKRPAQEDSEQPVKAPRIN